MDIATIDGLELEYEVAGSGEPVLLIDAVLPDGVRPLFTHPALAGFQLIHHHKRGWVGSTHTRGAVSVADHAADAAALLDHLGVRRAHIAGFSSGAAVAAQLALDAPEKVHSLTLLELTLVSLPAGQAFLQGAGPILDAYTSGDHEGALEMFLSAASGLDWTTCRSLLEERIPGVVTQSIKDAHTFFGVELPGLSEWTFSPEQAATINRPVLSVFGSDTGPVWVEVAQYLRTSLPYVEERTIDGVGHLLHIQKPDAVASEMADFVARNPMSDG